MTPCPKVRIDTNRIVDWNSFHDVFAEAFGFPDFYGRNMNAWSTVSPLSMIRRIG